MNAANRIVRYLLPVVMSATVLSALGVTTLVAEFTPADRLVSTLWIVASFVLAGAVASVPVLYWLARRLTQEIATALEAGVPLDELNKDQFAARGALAAVTRGPVTIVFASVEGLSRVMEVVTPEVAAELFDGLLRLCTDVVGEHGGVVERFTDRDVVFVFPARPDASAETAATEAAFRLAQLIPEMKLKIPGEAGLLRGLRFAAGVTAGSAVMGKLHGQPLILGEMVQQARAIANAGRARGVFLLVSHYVQTRLKPGFRVEPAGAINEMLAHQKVDVYAVTGLAPAGETPTPRAG